MSYQWTSAILGLGIALAIVWLIRRERMHTRYATWWLLVAGAIMLFGLVPRLVDILARPLGINYAPLLLVLIGMAFVLIKILTADIERSKQEQRVRRLTQRLAILESTLEQLRRSTSPTRNESDKTPDTMDEE